MNKKSTFNGLETCEKFFKRTLSPCSSVLENSCGTRDCQLEVYQLGDTEIYSGGRCPKGSTSSSARKVPNYIEMYKGILNKTLSEFVSPLEEMTDSPKILIPRSLTFLNEKGIFYATLYHNLGFDVSLSPPSDDEIANLGKQYAHPECCYPIILAHGHTAFLSRKMRAGKDKVLLPNAFSVGKDKLTFCPYVCSSGYLTTGSLDLKHEDVLLPDFKFEDPNYNLPKVISEDLRRAFGKFSMSQRKIRFALESAEDSQKQFIDSIYKIGRKILDRLMEKGEKIFVGIGRGYTLLDSKASSEIDKLFVANGIHYLPSYLIKSNLESEAVHNMYWYQGQSMLGSLIGTFKNSNVFPVRLTNFNCGPDSILQFHEERLTDRADKPYLCLETDGHNSNAQFGTRIQAHKRVTDLHCQEKSIDTKQLGKKLPKVIVKNKIIGVPYMGDSSDLLVASMRSFGLEAVVMPTRTEESRIFAKKIVTTNTCRPFAFQVGDHLAWLDSLKKQGTDPNKSAIVFMPSTKGPCRQGQYATLLRDFFDRQGFDNVAVISPNSADDYTLTSMEKTQSKKLFRNIFKGIVTNDILREYLHRIRPYEINLGQTDKTYKTSHNRLIKLVESNPSMKDLKRFLLQESKKFTNIPKKNLERFPLVLVNGEIFVRCHEKSNQDSIRLLEKNNLEVKLDSTFTWIDYVNRISLRESWKERGFKQFYKSVVKWTYMRVLRKILQKPFEKDLGNRMHYHNPLDMIDDLESRGIFSFNIQGESALSISEASCFIDGKLDIDGIYHVGPLGCMQETVATSRIHPLIQKKRKNAVRIQDQVIPFMDAVFGESESPALDSQIAIFAENCRLRKKLRKNK